MRVDQIMSTPVYFCRPDDSLETAARQLWDGDCGCLPVCEAGESNRPVAVVTDRDITMCAMFERQPLHALAVREAMSRNLHTCRAEDILAGAERVMREARVRRLPVIDEQGELVGVVSLADLVRQASRELKAPLREITDEEVADTLAAIVASGALPQVRAQ